MHLYKLTLVKKRKPQDQSWLSIEQVHERKLTPKAKKRFLKTRLQLLSFIGTLLVLFSITTLLYLLPKNPQQTSKRAANQSQNIRRIHVKTDGVLNAALLQPITSKLLNKPTSEIPIFRLKERLERIPQVRLAIIERRLPDQINIVLYEHKPCAKLFLKEANGKQTGLLVSSKGILFKGYGYSKKLLMQLPFLDGIEPVKTLSGEYLPIEHMPVVFEFLRTLHKKSKTLYKLCKRVSISYLHNDYGQYASFLKMTTASELEILFAPLDFSTQIDRLCTLFAYASEEKLKRMERIDLSLNNQAVIQLGSTRHG